MKTRSWINIALLLAVAVLLTVIVLRPGSDRLEPAPLTEHDPRAVDRFEIRYADNRPDLTLERHAEHGWQLVEPIRRSARPTRVVRVLSLLDDRTDSCYPPDEDRLQEFGLDQVEISLVVGDTVVDFGDRAADGRRHVLAGERLCLIDDFAYPLLGEGMAGVAVLALLPEQADPVAIETPEAAARNEGDGWEFSRGDGAGLRWAARWRAARASGFDFDPPDTDEGRVRIETDDGQAFEWRIAGLADEEKDLWLVPVSEPFAIRITGADAVGLLAPPAAVEDGLD